MNIIEDLNWRYATKKFDTSKKVDEGTIDRIKEAINLSASSVGLQPFTVLDIRDEKVRESLVEHTWGQRQIVEASHLFVFCSMKQLTDQYVTSFAETLRFRRGLQEKHRERTITVAGNVTKGKTQQEIAAWASEQAHIAVGTALVACASERVDSCPIGGFDPQRYSDILGLEEKGLNAVLVLPIGYRSDEDWNDKYPKGRKTIDELFQIV